MKMKFALASTVLLFLVGDACAEDSVREPKKLVLKGHASDPAQEQPALPPSQTPFSFLGITLWDDANTVMAKLEQSGIKKQITTVKESALGVNLQFFSNKKMIDCDDRFLVLHATLQAPWNNCRFVFSQDGTIPVGFFITTAYMPQDKEPLDGEIYQKLVEKFGEPDSKNRHTEYAVWSRPGQHLELTGKGTLLLKHFTGPRPWRIRFTNLQSVEYFNSLGIQQKAARKLQENEVLEKF